MPMVCSVVAAGLGSGSFSCAYAVAELSTMARVSSALICAAVSLFRAGYSRAWMARVRRFDASAPHTASLACRDGLFRRLGRTRRQDGLQQRRYPDDRGTPDHVEP